MAKHDLYALEPIGFIQSALRHRADAPRQGREGAPDAWLDVSDAYAEGLEDLSVGQDVILITWLHQSRRDVLKVRPRGNPKAALAGVFTTRSPDRPNPIGLHRVTILEIDGTRLRIAPLEAIDGTPVVDIKPILTDSLDA